MSMWWCQNMVVTVTSLVWIWWGERGGLEFPENRLQKDVKILGLFFSLSAGFPGDTLLFSLRL